MSALRALSNHIVLSIVLECITSAADIFALACTHNYIYQTLRDVIRGTIIQAITFERSKIRGNKAVIGDVPIFNLAQWRSIQILNLNRTHITIASVRSLLRTLGDLRVLQLVGCQRIHVGSINTLLQSLVKARRKGTVQPELLVLDVWDIDGLRLDYKYQNSKEWYFESFCMDNRNLVALQRLAMMLELQLNIQFCEGEDHSALSDIRYHPATRQKWGVSDCELVVKHASQQHLCETCILRLHNLQRSSMKSKHRCRQERDITMSDLTAFEHELSQFRTIALPEDISD